MFLAGLRFGEVSALSWRNLHMSEKPLGRLVVARSYNTRTKRVGLTKTRVTRMHPVHLTLAEFLEDWRTTGWPLFFGRTPNEDDLIVPSRRGRNRSSNHMKHKFDEDLEKLGLRKRRQHDSRKTWLTQLVADGANRDILERITHARSKDVMSGYIELEWPTLCAEVAKWTLSLPRSAAPVAPNDPTAPPDPTTRRDPNPRSDPSPASDPTAMRDPTPASDRSPIACEPSLLTSRAWELSFDAVTDDTAALADPFDDEVTDSSTDSAFCQSA